MIYFHLCPLYVRCTVHRKASFFDLRYLRMRARACQRWIVWRPFSYYDRNRSRVGQSILKNLDASSSRRRVAVRARIDDPKGAGRTEAERTARAQGTQGAGDPWAKRAARRGERT